MVQASSAYAFDNSYVADSVAAHPERFTACSPSTWFAPDAVAKMKHWMGKAHHRHAHSSPPARPTPEQETFFADEAALPVWQYASDQGLSVCMQMRVQGLPLLETVTNAFPRRGSFSITSRGRRPPTAAVPSAAPLWALAKYPNVYLKLTHRPIEQSVKGQSTPEAFLGKAIKEFGASRMCWGSNFPAAKPPLPELIDMAARPSISCRSRIKIKSSTRPRWRSIRR